MATRRWRDRLLRRIGWRPGAPLAQLAAMLATFHLVCLAWVFFRAESVSDALYVVTHLFRGLELRTSFGIGAGGVYELAIAAAAIALMEVVHLVQRRHGSIRDLLRGQPATLRWGAYYALATVILVFGKFGSLQFIYFQF